MGASVGLEVDPDPAPAQLLLDQEEHLLDQADQVRRLAAVGAGAGQAEDPAGDRGGALGGLKDLFKGPTAVLGVGVPEAELGVIQDRRQRVIELVADPPGEDPRLLTRWRATS